ncbi:SdrD B-like domain-containing protein [Olleya sp. R77988]|uniref:SdrD B-like domain-containing protein n=1 Tax=Olleya sp. R77988 TaxID=3093875 RepID=UPI0037C6032C
MNTKYKTLKNNDLESGFFSAIKLVLMTTILLFAFSCSDEEDCGYTSSNTPDCPIIGLDIGDPCDTDGDGILDGMVNVNCDCTPDGGIIDPDCNLEGELNLSTGIDANGDVIVAAFGAVDPFWKIINQPPIFQGTPGNPCTSTAVGTFTGETYAMNFNNFGNTQWVNQPGSTTIAPFDLGPNGSFGCNNASNVDGDRVPYVFERSFCVLTDTNVDFSFTYKGDDQVTFLLIDNATNTVLNTSATYVWSVDPILTWSATSVPLSVGSYSIRAQLVNTGAVILGFSFVGNMVTTNGDEAISNNSEGCCENNVISVLNILEDDCDRLFNNVSDQLGGGWTFNLLDATNALIRTETTDINGNIFFAGLADGTYTVQIVNQAGWTQTITSQMVTVANNQVEIVEFFSCNN